MAWYRGRARCRLPDPRRKLGDISGAIPEENIESGAGEFKFERRYVVAGGALSCRLVFVGRSDGFFRASVELTVNRDFRTNRAGFTVLHPIAGVAGTPLTVVRPDGTSTLASSPE